MLPFPGCLSPPVLLTTLSRRCTSAHRRAQLRHCSERACPPRLPRARLNDALAESAHATPTPAHPCGPRTRRAPSRGFRPFQFCCSHSTQTATGSTHPGAKVTAFSVGVPFSRHHPLDTPLFQTALSRTHTFTFLCVPRTYHPAVSTPLSQAHPLQLPRASGDSPHN